MPERTANLKQPRLKRYFQVEILESGAVCLLSEAGNFVLEGTVYTLLAPLMNGSNTFEDIVQHLAGRASRVQIQRALSRLQARGFLAEGSTHAASAKEQAFWDLQASHAGERAPGSRRSMPRRVGLHVLGDDAESVEQDARAVFESLDLPIVDRDATLDVVLTPDCLHPQLEAFNRHALANARAWLMAKPLGATPWIGPLFQPAEGRACWACLAQRLERNRLIERHVEHANRHAAPLQLARAALPSTIRVALTMTALEAARWLTVQESALTDRVVTLNTITLELHHHTLVKRPQCRVCGTATMQAPRPIVLQSRAKRWTADGGHRSAPPLETYERYKHHVSPITGAVKFLVRQNDSPLFNVYVADSNLDDPRDDWHRIKASTFKVVSGKGMQDIQARVSALGEALEHHSGLFQGTEPTRRASYAALRGEAIHPSRLLGYSDRQYETRAAWNRDWPHYLQVPPPLDDTREIDWTPVWSLTHQALRYVPTAYCYYGYRGVEAEPYCSANSNGNAAGSSLEDAILQGFLELVERDSTSLWWVNRLTRPAFDLDTLDDPYIPALRDFYASMKREFWVLDLTSDLGIPVFAAVTRRVDKPAEEIIIEYGAHFDPGIALRRALTEMNQVLPFGEGLEHLDRWTRRWRENATIANQPYIAPDPSMRPRTRADYTAYATGDLLEDVLHCVDIARRHGMEVLVLDQTRPDIGMPVVKVIVPGLAFHLARFGFPRLYTVPVKMGWRASQPTEESFNPEFLYL